MTSKDSTWISSRYGTLISTQNMITGEKRSCDLTVFLDVTPCTFATTIRRRLLSPSSDLSTPLKMEEGAFQPHYTASHLTRT
jgi:hypothetical protein